MKYYQDKTDKLFNTYELYDLHMQLYNQVCWSGLYWELYMSLRDTLCDRLNRRLYHILVRCSR